MQPLKLQTLTANITFFDHQVIKKVCHWRPVTRAYNKLLKGFYPTNDIMPVVAHEANALKALEPFDIAPRLKFHGKDFIVMTNVGKPYQPGKGMLVDKIERVKHILDSMKEVNIIHNDLLAQNLTVLNGFLYLVDFQLASIGGVSILAEMNRVTGRDNVEDSILESL